MFVYMHVLKMKLAMFVLAMKSVMFVSKFVKKVLQKVPKISVFVFY